MAGGSQIIISSDGITIKTPREFKVFAGQHKFESGAKVNSTLPSLPDAENPYILQYLVKNKENQIMVNKPYLIFDEDGNVQKGKTDQNGFMKLNTSSSEQQVTTRVMMNEVEVADEEESGDQE
ncbi:hypothetical protein [Acinetobacter indicus]|uniref:hypothetical protein n=1 Tax=Acinetobacter indicus TaxID=756892 RepID=UPI00143FF167|nr:hypothetical protein [Acinetobacter indicus]MDM1291079.1 hypothetical protein [Acinetobacter indicus]MDM1321186.1 hypothetical protein [Acinetobacter indicus]MDM1333580.1 hypothetical protein [Acinetobacter indicus]QIZ59012.1 hypothetical protein FK537_07720 [Acinetobacter indicus]